MTGRPDRPLSLSDRLAELRTAGAFLTILPVAPRAGGRGELAALAWCFPVVGLLLGGAAGLMHGLAIWLGSSDWLAATLAVATLVLLTGGLHEDGLGDFADGLGGTNRERRLAIMRDSGAGNFAILALLLLFAGRIGALDALAAPGRVFPALLAAAAVSRAAMVMVMAILPAARSDGLGAGAGRPGANMTLAAAGIALAIAWVALGFGVALAGWAGAALAAWPVAWLARRRLGGQTGDVLGAVQATSEVGCLLAVGLAI